MVYRGAKIQVLNRTHGPGVSILMDSYEGKNFFYINTGMIILLSIPFTDTQCFKDISHLG